MIRIAMMSVADTCIIPLQDYLYLGSEARINTPSTLGDNWKWRVRSDVFTKELSAKILGYTQIYAR
jgi:4-alpha-glucanotransferase